jgi:hypothetical protein
LTAQGHPRAIFKRAIENGNVLVAEATARELGRVSLGESLALVGLVAVKEPHRHSRYAVRWLRRLLEEDDGLTLEEAALAVSALAALGGPSTEHAQSTLSAMAERANSRRQRRRIAS